ncbi:MAG: HAMP domain-containing protein [Bacteroidales bacterium]|nr:HAMP domain-containing protein [Bacteroidales bacterium]
MKNLKIRFKLFLGFAAVLLILLVVGIREYMVLGKLETKKNDLLKVYEMADAIMEAKYAVRSDMQLLMEILTDNDQESFNKDWADHEIAMNSFDENINAIISNAEDNGWGQKYTSTKSDIKKTANDVGEHHDNNIIPNFKSIKEYTEKLLEIAGKDESSESISDLTEIADIQKNLSHLDETTDEAGIEVITKLEVLEEQIMKLVDGAKTDMDQMSAASRKESIILVIAGLLLAIILSLVITSAIAVPVKKGVEFAKIIAEGDLSATLDIDQKDEIGELADALKDMVRSFRISADVAIKIANGNLTKEAEIPEKDRKGELPESLQNMVLKLREIVSNILEGSDSIASASQQLSSSAQEMSQGATEQASSAEEVSSSIEEMTANIEQNTSNAQETEKISRQASEGMNKVGGASQESLVSIKTIAEKINIINDIAFQTNILALNAAVEAARAGEHGKGFAVVAAEVRKLAERSKVAADEIVELSGKSVGITSEASKLIDQLLPQIENTSKLVQEITAASLEQNSGATQINSAIQQLNQVTQQNAAAAEEMSTSSEELSSQADQLRGLISYFQIDDYKYNQKKQYKRHHIEVARMDKHPKNTGIDIKMHAPQNTNDEDFEKF